MNRGEATRGGGPRGSLECALCSVGVFTPSSVGFAPFIRCAKVQRGLFAEPPLQTPRRSSPERLRGKTRHIQAEYSLRCASDIAPISSACGVFECELFKTMKFMHFDCVKKGSDSPV